jgi:hypothetical protein
VWVGCFQPPILPFGTGVPTRSSHHRFANEWLSKDGDVRGPVGERRYQRSARFLVVRLATGQNSASLTNLLNLAENGLQDCAVSGQIRDGFWLIRLSNSLCQQHLGRPAELQVLLDRLRKLPAIESVNPILREVGQTLGLVYTGEIILRLAPGVVAEGYFGAGVAQARRVRGTSDQWVLRIPGCRMEEVVEQCRIRSADQRVVWVEPHFLQETVKHTTDPLYALQWHLQNSGAAGAKAGADVKAVAAWALQKGKSNIVIAVLDDGVELKHPDLKPRLFRNTKEVPNNRIDDDDNGYVDDVQGWDFLDRDSDPSPVGSEDGHGTAVAGVAVAAANNGIGGAGLAYGCSVLPIRFASKDFSPRIILVESIYYAAGRTADGYGTWRGADVINISYGGGGSFALQEAVSYAARHGRGGLGAPIFASSGNSASKWSKFDLPVGKIFGAGTFKFGFRYTKDSSDSGPAVEDLARIDDIALVGSDFQTIRSSALGLQGRQDFEPAAFPPTGWAVSGSQAALTPFLVSDGSFSGTGGKQSVQFSPRLNDQWSEIITPAVTLKGDEFLRFRYYISSEGTEALGYGFDGLIVRVYNSRGSLVYTIDDPFRPGRPLLWGTLRS